MIELTVRKPIHHGHGSVFALLLKTETERKRSLMDALFVKTKCRPNVPALPFNSNNSMVWAIAQTHFVAQPQWPTMNYQLNEKSSIFSLNIVHKHIKNENARMSRTESNQFILHLSHEILLLYTIFLFFMLLSRWFWFQRIKIALQPHK